MSLYLVKLLRKRASILNIRKLTKDLTRGVSPMKDKEDIKLYLCKLSG